MLCVFQSSDSIQKRDNVIYQERGQSNVVICNSSASVHLIHWDIILIKRDILTVYCHNRHLQDRQAKQDLTLSVSNNVSLPRQAKPFYLKSDINPLPYSFAP